MMVENLKSYALCDQCSLLFHAGIKEICIYWEMLLARKHQEEISWTRPFLPLHRLTHQLWSQTFSNRAELRSAVRWFRNWDLWHINRDLQLVGWLCIQMVTLWYYLCQFCSTRQWSLEQGRDSTETLYLKANIVFFSSICLLSKERKLQLIFLNNNSLQKQHGIFSYNYRPGVTSSHSPSTAKNLWIQK